MIDLASLTEYNTLVVMAGTMLLGACAGMLGCFAILRRKALTGDALAHAALPGLCAAFLFLGQRSLPEMLLGAFLSGLAGLLAITAITHWTRIKEDAALGIVLSVFFGAGIALSSWIQHLPLSGKAGLDSYILGKTAGMLLQDVQLIGGLALLCLIAVGVLYKELQLTTFDAGFARVQGWPAAGLDLLMMGMIAVGVVIGLPAVGVVMISALLILPGVSARFWTDKLPRMLVLAAVIGAMTGLIGTALSAQSSMLPAGPIIVLVGSGFFLLSLLLAPRRGLGARWRHEARLRRELGLQNLLRGLWELYESAPGHRTAFTRAEIAERFARQLHGTHAALRDACRLGYLVRQTDSVGYALTAEGLQHAMNITRQHRLWVALIQDSPEAAVTVNTLTDPMQSEYLDGELLQRLIAQLQAAQRWPVLAREAGT